MELNTTSQLSATSTAPATTTSSGSSSQSADLSQTLGQKDFLKLMVAQIQNQDPFAPMENGDFIGQMAQFSSVDGINKISASMESLTTAFSHGQSLQAAGLVGRDVVAPSEVAILAAGKPVSGEVELTESVASVVVDISDSQGRLVDSIDLGSHTSGTVPFRWDGRDADGNQMDSGIYRVMANATVNGEVKSFETRVATRVESVALGGGNQTPQLYLADGTNIGLDKVKQIH